jgi:ABC-type dipeptide/oligopeptide/nickel transport system permease component
VALYAKGVLRMNINATIYGQLLIVFMLLIGIICYYQGKRKTNSPKIVTLIGVLLCSIPPLAIIYVFVFIFKNKLPPTNAENGLG